MARRSSSHGWGPFVKRCKDAYLNHLLIEVEEKRKKEKKKNEQT